MKQKHQENGHKGFRYEAQKPCKKDTIGLNHLHS